MLEDRGYLLKKYCLNFKSTQNSFFYFFCLSIYKIVDSEHSMDVYKSAKTNIGTIMRKPGMLEFVLDCLKTKAMLSMQLKNYLF